MSVIAENILAYFDYALEKRQWPELFGGARDRAYHAMRLIAVRSRDGWGLLFERLEGEGFDGRMASPYTFGSGTENLGWLRGEPWGFSTDAFFLEELEEEDAPRGPFSIEGLEVVGPKGALVLRDEMVVERDLRPGRVGGLGVKRSLYSLCLRAYLASYPDAFWRDPTELIPALELGADAHVVLIAEAFEHCAGPEAPAAYPPAWRLSPGASTTYQSLARAIAADDASLFVPGESNLDFRLHALHETGEVS